MRHGGVKSDAEDLLARLHPGEQRSRHRAGDRGLDAPVREEKNQVGTAVRQNAVDHLARTAAVHPEALDVAGEAWRRRDLAVVHPFGLYRTAPALPIEPMDAGARLHTPFISFRRLHPSTGTCSNGFKVACKPFR